MGRWRVRPRRLMRSLVVLAIGAWGTWVAGDKAAAWVAATFGPTDAARFGEIVEAYPGTLVVVRREQLLPAPQPGRVVALVSEGQSVATGTPLVRLEAPGGPAQPAVVSAPFAGVMSFLADGWEQWGDAEYLAGLSFPLNDPPRPRLLAARETVARGEPVVRLVDRSELYAVFWPKKGRVPRRVGEGARVELVEGAGEAGLPAQVVKVAGQEGDQRLVIRLERQPAGWLYRRVSRDVHLVVARHAGVVLPASGLTIRGGRTGYWAATGGGPSFVPVQVVSRLGGQVVARRIPEGVRVYRWPRWLGTR